MTYEPIWLQWHLNILFQNEITLLEKGETSPRQRAHNEIVKKNPLIKNTFTCWTLFSLGIVINDIPQTSFHRLILHLEVDIFCSHSGQTF